MARGRVDSNQARTRDSTGALAGGAECGERERDVNASGVSSSIAAARPTRGVVDRDLPAIAECLLTAGYCQREVIEYLAGPFGLNADEATTAVQDARRPSRPASLSSAADSGRGRGRGSRPAAAKLGPSALLELPGDDVENS